MEDNEVPYAGPGKVFFKEKLEPNYQLALKAIRRREEFEWVDSLDPAEPENDSGNHFFLFGYVVYSAWNLEDEGGWVAEMSPIIADGEIVGYTIVEIERIL